jgi:predicted nucleic acid-binding protein
MALIWPAEAGSALVADTSVIINLNATGYAAAILRALPVRVVTPDTVQSELEHGRAKGRHDADLLSALVADGLIDIVSLGERGSGYFEELVIGTASETLDDGEAATIACALERDLPALIDESKAMRICAVRYPMLALGCTVDLLAHRAVGREMKDDALTAAVLNALQRGRMRVFPQHLDWVLRVIGPEQAAKCPSLPRTARGRRPRNIADR